MLLKRLLVLTTLTLSVLSTPTQPREDQSVADWPRFQSLLDEVDGPSIRAALYALAPKFKDGVFSKDRTALEQVHSENPAVASKLLNLAKRQSNSTATTTTDSPSSTTSSAAPSSTTTSAAPSSTTTSTTSAAASSTTTPASTAAASSTTTVDAASASASSSSAASIASSISSDLSSEITASTSPPVTTITVPPTAPASATAIATLSNAVVYSTYGGGLVTVTSSKEQVSFTPSTSTHIVKTTLGNGDVQTSTAVVVVNAPVTTGVGAASGTAGAAATTAGSPGLQNGASSFETVFVAQVAAAMACAVALAMCTL